MKPYMVWDLRILKTAVHYNYLLSQRSSRESLLRVSPQTGAQLVGGREKAFSMIADPALEFPSCRSPLRAITTGLKSDITQHRQLYYVAAF